jgi:hypothetical protein
VCIYTSEWELRGQQKFIVLPNGAIVMVILTLLSLVGRASGE